MQNFTIVLYILSFTLVSSFLFMGITKDKRKEVIPFFFFCDFFVLSAVKAVLGSTESTLFESFWDIQFRTYVNYAMPLLLLAIIMPLIIRFVFKEKALKLFKSANAFMFIALILVWIVTGKVSNGGYCIAFMVSAVLACWMFILTKRKCSISARVSIRNTQWRCYRLLEHGWLRLVSIFLQNCI